MIQWVAWLFCGGNQSMSQILVFEEIGLHLSNADRMLLELKVKL